MSIPPPANRPVTQGAGLDESRLQASLVARGCGPVQLDVLAQCESTNSWLMQAPLPACVPAATSLTQPLSQALGSTDDAGLSDRPWRVCVTQCQTGGRGRRGKAWMSDDQGIALSLATPLGAQPAAELMGISLVSGVAVSEALQELTGCQVMVKWPNDLIMNDRKVGGILTELITGADARLVTGVGINLVDRAELRTLGMGGAGLSASVDLLPDLHELVAGMIDHLCRMQHSFLTGQWSFSDPLWICKDWLSGKLVKVEGARSDNRAALQGRAVGVDEAGALRVDAGGRIQRLHAGEVSVRTMATDETTG